MYMAGKWIAAAGEGKTVNRDWSNKHCGFGFYMSINRLIGLKLLMKSQYVIS